VLYVTGQIGREKTKPADEEARSGEMPVNGPTISIEEVMRLATIEAEPFAIQAIDLSDDLSDDEPPPPGEVQQLKMRLLQFLQECLGSDAVKKHLPGGQLDARNRFGFHLFMLGAGQACLAALPKALKLRLSDLVEQALSALGSDAVKSRSFADGIAGYQKEVKNAAMIRAGYEAMSGFLKDNKLIGTGLQRAMQIWNSADRDGASGDPASQDVVIMFTDMVSSVETTQQIGDEGMMKLVDQHNLIVGAVLKTMRGHQVKHTGDGVMAVFPRVVDGVAAAAEIQKQIADFNSVTQGALLKVRIGISAGNPIRKDDDYFGTVVQTAARVCPIAGAGEIALPDMVTRFPGCERFTYSEAVAVPLKGFSEPQLVRKLLWGGAAPVARAAPPPVPAATPVPVAAPVPSPSEMAQAD
jgi:class 3 adenylate cyclase